jgi:hypothetical protein
MDENSMELGIRLSFDKTSEFLVGGFEPPIGTPLPMTVAALPTQPRRITINQ